VTAELAGAVTVADVMAVITAQGEHELSASGSGIALRDGDHVRYHVLKGYGAEVRTAWRNFDVGVPSPVPSVLRTGEPLFLGSREEILAGFPQLSEFLEASGEQALARLPLTTPTGTIGVLSLGFTQPRRFSAEEQDYLIALAGQCAQALERAQLFERARDTALLLQRSLLPDTLPVTAGYAVAAHYQPGSAEAEVGGDWYDALLLPDGRLAVAVGDVMGKGVRAASVMGQVRNALRGLVHVDPAPRRVLGWLDALVAHLGGDEEFVTLAYGLLDPADGSFVWSSAGHPPPLLVADEASRLLDVEPSLPSRARPGRPARRHARRHARGASGDPRRGSRRPAVQ
jgi:hypothetical protein